MRFLGIYPEGVTSQSPGFAASRVAQRPWMPRTLGNPEYKSISTPKGLHQA